MVALLVVTTAFASGCAAPIGVERVGARAAQHDLTSHVLSTGERSEWTRDVLRLTDQQEAWADDPRAVLAELHALRVRPVDRYDAELRAEASSALAELAFAEAMRSGDRRYYLAAALYAWTYLFPEDPARRPDPLERSVRLCADLYNRSLTQAFGRQEGGETGEVVLRQGAHPLPFGRLVVDLDESGLSWGDRRLDRFVSLADLRIRGLNNRYRLSGIGAPLAAHVASGTQEHRADVVLDGAYVPVTAVLRFDGLEESFATGEYRATLSVIAHADRRSIRIDEQLVPLEVEPSALLAYQLTETPPWARELRGLFQGDLALGRLGLASLSPYRRGRIPLVLVHGTASSAGRWADLVNDLHADPVLRRRYQIWWFTYNTGNPIAYSGWLLRKALAERIREVDPQGLDPALGRVVVLGHSQGGLLTKLQAVDAGDAFWKLVVDEPPERVELEPAHRELLEGSLLVEPSPYVDRVIFLSTPHRGSRLATLGPARLLGRLIRTPANVVAAVVELVTDDDEAEVRRRLDRGGGSIGNMSPDSRFIQVLAALPIAPGVHAHSIIGVRSEPKQESGDGVVAYASAHLDDVESERVVRSGHSSQANPKVIAEVRRILLEHLAEAVEEGAVPALVGSDEQANATRPQDVPDER